jgi:hypothetical protein
LHPAAIREDPKNYLTFHVKVFEVFDGW